MKRAIARGRVFPQSYSTDRRYGRLSLKACALFPLMWANGDDQGRLSGDPEEVKYAVCPNIDHIAKEDIPSLLEELDKNKLIKLYVTSKTQAIQMLDWWDVQRLQWAWPSDYAPPEGWKDRLRYKRGREQVVTENWGDSPESSPEPSPESSPETKQPPPENENEKEEERGKGRGRGRGRGNSPEHSGEKPTPSLINSTLFDYLVKTYPEAFGRQPNSREAAQMRDLGVEISSAGGATAEQIHDAFKEAAVHQKFSISYVRAILLDWLGVARSPPQ